MGKSTNINPMKTLITLACLITMIVACKKTETTPNNYITHEVHGLINVEIESNGKIFHNVIYKTDTLINYVNHKTLYENFNNSTNYTLDSKEVGWYQIYSLSNFDSLIIPNNNLYIKLKVTDQFGKILLDSIRSASIPLSSKWQTGIVFNFQVK